MDGQNTIIASKLFKWVVINLPFAGPCFSRNKMRLAFSKHCWRNALGIFWGLIGTGQGMRAWEGGVQSWCGLTKPLWWLIFTESLITTNWEGQFKYAQRISDPTSVTWFRRGLRDSLNPCSRLAGCRGLEASTEQRLCQGVPWKPADLRKRGLLVITGSHRQTRSCPGHLESQQLTEGENSELGCQWTSRCDRN